MKIVTLTEEIKGQIKKAVELLFSGSEKEVAIDCCCPSEVFKIIEAMGVEVDNEEWDTNGCQYDYWQYFTHQEKRYCISGSGYYGNVMIKVE